jgi:hypothetical protein
VLPLPRVLSTSILPPSNSIERREIAKPIPELLSFLDRAFPDRQKRSKTKGKSSAEIPLPVSMTAIHICLFSVQALRVIEPLTDRHVVEAGTESIEFFNFCSR